jgi:hypothetical protein
MKKILIVFLFLIISASADSQVLIALLLGDKLNSDKLKFGVEGGLNMSTISGFESNKPAKFFNLGFYFDFLLKDQWRLYTGALVKSNLGLAELTTADLAFLQSNIYPVNGNYRQVASTFLVPVFIKYDFKNHFYIEAGPEFGLNHKAFIEFRSDENGTSSQIKQENKDMFKWIEAGFGGGFGYTLFKGEGVTIGVKYYHGLTDIYKDRAGTKSSSLSLKANIRIGASKNTEPKN